MKAIIMLFLALPALADDLEMMKADIWYAEQAYAKDMAYEACYEHLASIDPALALTLESCMTDDECHQATQLCDGYNNE